MKIVLWKRLSYALAAVGLMAIALVAKDVRTISVRDECDPASFNAAVGAGTCIGDGDVTFDEFLAAIPDGGHEKWRFNEVVTDADVAVNANNRGGEAHTFTPVDHFGGGFIPLLNAALPESEQEPIAECAARDANGNTIPDGIGVVPAADALATIIPPDGKNHLTTPLKRGTNRFQCCIHPWMRSTVTRR